MTSDELARFVARIKRHEAACDAGGSEAPADRAGRLIPELLGWLSFLGVGGLAVFIHR
jgi:hypothetical protein